MKKRVFVVALVVCMLAILSVGSLAWFNDSKSITNDFFVGTSEDDNNPEFSVKVSETGTDGLETTVGNEYFNVLPGATIDKNPTVTNTGDFTQWIRVKVTLNKAQGWIAAGGTVKFTELFEGAAYGDVVADANNANVTWLLVNDDAAVDGDNATWYLYLRTKLDPDDYSTLFTSVKIPTNFTQQEMAAFGNTFSISVVAEALQYEHTGDSAVEAFTNVGWTEGTEYQDT